MTVKRYAQLLGRRGGQTRAKRLTPERLREIASAGGAARAASIAAARRVADNFVYLRAIEVLRGTPIQVESVSECAEPLPGLRREQARA